MEIIKQWIVDGCKHLVQLKNGDFMLGGTTNFYGYEKISKSYAYTLLN